MKIRKESEMENEAETRLTSSQEMRDLAEALSLYRSAMQHVAAKQAARPFAMDRKPAPSFRMRLVMVPALAAALAVAVIVPAVSHLHGHAGTKTGSVVEVAPQTPATNVVQMDDAQLMDQIDNDLTEDVPDALQPLADMGTQTTAGNTSGAEKK